MFGKLKESEPTDTSNNVEPTELPESIFERNKQKEQDRQNKTTISKGCVITGEVSGDNDMEVFGTVEGTVSLNGNTFTVEESAQVNANISAKHVNINGKVVGNINAIEKIVINDTGQVTGDMVAPKVVLKDGSYFKGGISMVENKVKSTPVNGSTTSKSKATEKPATKAKTETKTSGAQADLI